MNYDKEFLKQLDIYPHKEKYVRITSLDRNEYPREQIEGQCTGGSINVDGASALRRSCQLTLLAFKDQSITDSYWAFKHKFKLEIGLANKIDNRYPDIIWFKQGIYVINSFNKTENTNGQIQITLSGQDKMCLLNGTLGGSLPHQVDFGTEENVDIYGNIHIEKIPIYKIIYSAMQVYGQERPENIIINDLAENGWELWDYRGDKPMYLIYKLPKEEKEIYGQVINITFNEDTQVKLTNNETIYITNIPKYRSMNSLDKDYNNDATVINYGGFNCNVVKITNGETVGYHQIDLVYNDNLVANAGEALTSVLDKIKNMLGDFEYFYNLDGKFVFQKKNTYIQELFSPVNGDIVEPTMIVSPYSYKFEDKNLFTSFSTPPKIDNVKNDFTIWGQREGIGGTPLPIHVRYAIDKKPTEYRSPWKEFSNLCFLKYTQQNELEGDTTAKKLKYAKENNIYYWDATTFGYNIITSSIIADNKKTYFKLKEYKSFDELEKDVGTNKKTTQWHSVLYKRTYAGQYRPFFLEMLDTDTSVIGKTLYNTEGEFELKGKTFTSSRYDNKEVTIYDLKYKNNNKLYRYAKTLNYAYGEGNGQLYKASSHDWRELIYQMAKDYYQHGQEPDFFYKIEKANPWALDGRTGYEQYYSELQGFWRQLYNPEFKIMGKEEYYDNNSKDKYWNKKIHTDPYSLNFWFDFLDVGEGAELSKYSVKEIGQRSKVDNQTSINSIYNKDTPEIQFIVMPTEQQWDQQTSYQPIWIQDNMRNLFIRSTQGQSCIQKINELIYLHTCCNETISLPTIPIYYLEPNTRVQILNEDYTLDKISYNLSQSGTMTISGTKIIKQFY